MPATIMAPISAKTGRFVDDSCESGERTYATFNHLVGLTSLLDGLGLVGPIAALVMWRIKARAALFLDDHGREAVNFQLSLLAYALGGIVAGVLFAVVTLGVGAVVFALAPIFVLALTVLRLVGCIRGAMAASRGEYYRYPMCIRFISTPDIPAYACHHCAYDLRGTHAPNCPECGTPRA